MLTSLTQFVVMKNVTDGVPASGIDRYDGDATGPELSMSTICATLKMPVWSTWERGVGVLGRGGGGGGWSTWERGVGVLGIGGW